MEQDKVDYAFKILKGNAMVPVSFSGCISAIGGLPDEAILMVVDDLLCCVETSELYQEWLQERVEEA